MAVNDSFEHFSHRFREPRTDFERVCVCVCVRRNFSESEWIWWQTGEFHVGTIDCWACTCRCISTSNIDLAVTEDVESISICLSCAVPEFLFVFVYDDDDVHQIVARGSWLVVNLLCRFKLCAKIEDGTWGSDLVTNDMTRSDHMFTANASTRGTSMREQKNSISKITTRMRRGENNWIDNIRAPLEVLNLTFQCAHRRMCLSVFAYDYYCRRRWRRHPALEYFIISIFRLLNSLPRSMLTYEVPTKVPRRAKNNQIIYRGRDVQPFVRSFAQRTPTRQLPLK